jgi:hypothetical protein
MKRTAFILLIVITLNYFSVAAYAQSGISINRAIDEIVLDGEMNEESWKNARLVTNFTQYYPTDSLIAEARTEIRLTYDDKFIYVYAWMEETKEGKYVTSTLRRDYRGGASDGITIVFDTFKDQTNAFVFGVNPFNVQREALVANGGSQGDDFDLSWDNKWYSQTGRGDGYWTAELAIPFKSIRFKNGVETWNVNFYRIDTRYNERSIWTPIPRNFEMFTLAFTQKMQWDKPLEKTGPNISLIPYVSGGISKDHENLESQKETGNIGFDTKIGVTPGLNLDLTVNPDFSQVEVDVQQTNLSRFELFFPERRQFFLENADLFSNYGFERSSPFFSRRIGIVRDTINDINLQNPILFGARLSGKLNNNLRLGILNMQSAKDDEVGIPSLNYSVITLQQKVFRRSNVSAFFVNKQNFTEDYENDSTDFNRVFGIYYNLSSADAKWNGKLFYHQSVNPYKQDHDFAHGLYLEYSVRTFGVEWAHEWVGENYDAQVGFVPRKGFLRLNPELSLRFYPKSGIINNHGPRGELSYVWSEIYGKLDHELQGNYNISFQSGANASVDFTQNFIYLTDPFDPTNMEGVELPAFSKFTYYDYRLSFRSNDRRAFYFNINHQGGEYFNGTRYGISGGLNLRAQPYVLITANFNYNNINLPEPFSDADLFLFGPKLDVTFTRNLFLTTFFQFNNQSENVNINARLQWRFKPVSDVFLVYTDNYASTNWAVKNRAIVVKVTYWLNL